MTRCSRIPLVLALAAAALASVFAGAAAAQGYRACTDTVDLGTPSDPRSACEWWLADSYRDASVLHYGTGAAALWPQSRGAGVTVAVVDTGVEPDHPDLLPNLLVNEGYDFWNKNSGEDDGYGHGTLVAGIIAAAEGNGGYVGVAPQAKILPVKVMGPEGQFSDAAADRGTLYAVRSSARIVNLSWGSFGARVKGIQDALSLAAARDKLVVIAAGNHGADLDGHVDYAGESPNSVGYPTSLTVANLTWLNELAPDSNYGRFHVQIAAPGSGIEGDYTGGWYGGGSGTSFAAPQVAGVSALLFSLYPQATAAQIRRALLVGGRKLPQLRGKVECGCMVDAAGALAAMATPDTTPPTAFRVTGPRSTLRVKRASTYTLRWSSAHDAELEGYKLVVDGRMIAAHPAATHLARFHLDPGEHTWRLVAYDLSGNDTPATISPT